VDGAHDSAASVDSVAHCPHDDGSCSRIQTCTPDPNSHCLSTPSPAMMLQQRKTINGPLKATERSPFLDIITAIKALCF